MSDLDDKLNFNDISGKKSNDSSPKKKKISHSLNKTGTTILVPVNDNMWVDKDLADTTGNEFVAWAGGIYPISLKNEETKYNSLAARVHKFKEIMQYHFNSPFQLGRNNKRNTTVH